MVVDPALPSPYVGLAPYTTEQAPLFFGREREAEIVAANLMSRPITVLFGAAGVGKSSLLQAGLARHLQGLSEPNEGEDGGVALAICSSWRDDPVQGLVLAVRGALTEPDRLPQAGDLVAILEAATTRCRELFVVLDQFEEYFLYHGSGDDYVLAGALRRAIAERSLRVNFLISIREDALAKLDRLGEIPHLFEHRLQVDHLDGRAAHSAIVEPLRVFSSAAGDGPVTIEQELVDAVLADADVARAVGIGDIATSAPDLRIEPSFLQLVMERLWEEEPAAGSRTLRLETFRRLGGAPAIVETHLDRSLDRLSYDDQAIAAATFRFLVTRSGLKIAHAVSDLAEWAQVPFGDVQRLVDELARARILRRVVPLAGSGDEPRYEIYHGVLAEAILAWSARRREREALRREREAWRQAASASRLRTLVAALAATCALLGVALVIVVVHSFG